MRVFDNNAIDRFPLIILFKKLVLIIHIVNDLWGLDEKPKSKPPVRDMPDFFGHNSSAKKSSKSNERDAWGTASKPPKQDDFGSWGAAKKRSPIHDDDDFDFGGPPSKSVFNKGSPEGPAHMPTFGANMGGSQRSGSRRSGSRKKDDEDDEFDNILDSIVGDDDIGKEPPPTSERKRVTKHSSMAPIDPGSVQASAHKEELEKKKRALFGFSGSSEGKPERLNFGVRSQVAPDDGARGIDKDQTNSSFGGQMGGNTSAIDASPIGVIATSNSRRMAKRKTPSMGGGNSLQNSKNARSNTYDSGSRQGTGGRFNQNAPPAPNFSSKGKQERPPRPNSQNPPAYFITPDDDDDDSFERDDEEDILNMMDAPDFTKNKQKSTSSISPQKKRQTNPYNKKEDDDDEDIFSGGYVPSTIARNKGMDDTKSRGKSDVSNEATPISRGRKQMIASGDTSGGFKRGSRDSFSPPDATEGNYMQNKQGRIGQPSSKRIDFGSGDPKSSIGVIPKSTSQKDKNRDLREKSIPLDERTRAKLELEDARERTLEMEKRMKKEIEEIRVQNKKDVVNIESHYNKMLETHNREIKKLSDDMYLSIKQERDKLEVINKNEIENKKKQYEIELGRQREIYADQNSVFENQLKQQIELNKMLDQVKTSTSNIDSTLTQLSEDKTRGLQYHIEE